MKQNNSNQSNEKEILTLETLELTPKYLDLNKKIIPLGDQDIINYLVKDLLFDIERQIDEVLGDINIKNKYKYISIEPFWEKFNYRYQYLNESFNPPALYYNSIYWNTIIETSQVYLKNKISND